MPSLSQEKLQKRLQRLRSILKKRPHDAPQAQSDLEYLRQKEAAWSRFLLIYPPAALGLLFLKYDADFKLYAHIFLIICMLVCAWFHSRTTQAIEIFGPYFPHNVEDIEAIQSSSSSSGYYQQSLDLLRGFRKKRGSIFPGSPSDFEVIRKYELALALICINSFGFFGISAFTHSTLQLWLATFWVLFILTLRLTTFPKIQKLADFMFSLGPQNLHEVEALIEKTNDPKKTSRESGGADYRATIV